MTRSRSKFGRFVDHMRRNVLSYKYLRHNILMTALVVVMALCVFAVISFGEKADPLADELYANDSVTINKSQAVMMADSSVQLVPAVSAESANDTARVASNASGSIQSVTSASTEAVTTEEATTEETPSEVLPGVTASVIYDGVYVHTEQSSESDIIATVNCGEMFAVVSQDESWIGVQLYDGSIGFISTEYVSVDASLQ